nr:Uncharacterised protein [Citrobacter werkmanii]CAD0188604.1 Metabolism_regulation [Citrobacter werkmanii]
MKLVSHKELHNEWMQDDEYRALHGRKKNVRKSSGSCLLNGASMTT